MFNAKARRDDRLQVELVISEPVIPRAKAILKSWIEFIDEYKKEHSENCTLLVKINQ